MYLLNAKRWRVVKMIKICLITISLCLLLVGPSCKKSQEEPATTTEEKVEKKAKKKLKIPMKVESEDAIIKIIDKSDNTIGIDLANTVPIRIVQFVIKGVKITEIHTTSRTKGFYAKHNARNDKIVLLSPSDKAIAPGSGLIAEILCDKGGTASLSEIKTVQ